MEKKRNQHLLLLLLIGMAASGVMAQKAKYPPLSEYLMPQADEVALAKSAAPQNISDHATIRVFTTSGYHTVHEGDNGFVCMVMRGFTVAPTFTSAQMRAIVYDSKLRAPICLNPQAVGIVLPYYELRTKLGLEGKTPDQMAERVKAAYAKGEIPKLAGKLTMRVNLWRLANASALQKDSWSATSSFLLAAFSAEDVVVVIQQDAFGWLRDSGQRQG